MPTSLSAFLFLFPLQPTSFQARGRERCEGSGSKAGEDAWGRGGVVWGGVQAMGMVKSNSARGHEAVLGLGNKGSWEKKPWVKDLIGVSRVIENLPSQVSVCPAAFLQMTMRV